ncbi:MAG: hypothetical protein JRD68_05070 [Deltaproteobacteria bacterium]|nr:hypothetical protein [Deltaproteobacteria bacterium]
MITNKKLFYGGIVMMMGFLCILTIMFMPVFNDKNALEYMDELYNSISKHSAYSIPKLKIDAEKYRGTALDVTIDMHDKSEAEHTVTLLTKNGVAAELSGTKVTVRGDLGKILETSLFDADKMHVNDGQTIREKYGLDERLSLYLWWKIFEELQAELRGKKEFDQAKILMTTSEKVIEPAYNYYGITPEKISGKLVVVVLSLVFYLVYTVWYGFSILYIFEGLGFSFDH